MPEGRRLGVVGLLVIVGVVAGFIYILWGVFGPPPGLTLKDAPPPVDFDESQAVRGKVDADGRVVVLRPLLSRVAAGDPVWLALHWQLPKGPIPVPKDRSHAERYDLTTTVRSMVLEVAGPGGKLSLPLRAAQPPSGARDDRTLWAKATLLLILEPEQLRVAEQLDLDRPTYRCKVPWPVPAPGTYRISLRGRLCWYELKRQPVPFRVGPVTVVLGREGYVPREKILEAVVSLVANRYPEVRLDAFWSRHVAEDKAGHRIVRWHGTSLRPDCYRVYSARISPTGKADWIGAWRVESRQAKWDPGLFDPYYQIWPLK